MEILGEAAAEGRLTLDEYADRTGLAYTARVRADLARLTDDLPRPGTAGTDLAPSTAHPPVRREGVPDAVMSTAESPDELVAIFGNESRKGSWLVPRHLTAKSIFGDCHIDMQDARLQHPVSTIDATVAFGSVTVFVPDGVEVRLTGRAVFGAKESHLTGAPLPGAPVVEVRCRVWFGSVDVRPKRR